MLSRMDACSHPACCYACLFALFPSLLPQQPPCSLIRHKDDGGSSKIDLRDTVVTKGLVNSCFLRRA
ncbi:hypothetical protein SORBI_3008G053101 [Sorghum bicolor]|uniref:Uncharacterized protein n=1 Tax=Sorghum bicolor TaxID=4558 RepID=C5YSP9_SORBI|nr:hypothetical protein SORBI_3008G053101 [Sorghum bicolor]